MIHLNRRIRSSKCRTTNETTVTRCFNCVSFCTVEIIIVDKIICTSHSSPAIGFSDSFLKWAIDENRDIKREISFNISINQFLESIVAFFDNLSREGILGRDELWNSIYSDISLSIGIPSGIVYPLCDILEIFFIDDLDKWCDESISKNLGRDIRSLIQK